LFKGIENGGYMQNTTRKNSPPIKVYCLPEERKLIGENARAAGLSMARYLREVGQGYQITGVMDYEKVLELARINGDLGRLGGLLKMWLSNDERVAHIGYTTIHSLLLKIEKTQEEMGRIMMSIVMPRKKF
jgi:Mobilization protein NikA